MNARYTTVALVVALVYEMLLKLGRSFVPSLLDALPVIRTTAVLSPVVAVVIALFLISFYYEERANKKVGLVVLMLIGFMVAHSIIRLPMARNMMDYKVHSLVGEAIGFIQSILLFTLLMIYARAIPDADRLKQAAVLLTALFGINMFKSLLSLALFTRFCVSGVTTDFPPVFYNTMLVLFLVMHASMVYFLYRYYQSKSLRGFAGQA